MTPQEIFDTVARHAVTQGKRASDEDGSCKYRTPEGYMCFAGAVLPDGSYDPAMEGIPAGDVAERFQKTLPGYFLCNIDLIEHLQEAHDCVGNWNATEMQYQLRSIAEQYDIDPSILDTLDFHLIGAEAA